MEYQGKGPWNSKGKAIRVEGELRGVPNSRRVIVTAAGKFRSGGRIGGLPSGTQRRAKRGR